MTFLEISGARMSRYSNPHLIVDHGNRQHTYPQEPPVAISF